METSIVIGVVSVAALSITAVIYGLQLRAMRKAHQLQSLLAILRYVDNPELRRARWFANEHMAEVEQILQRPHETEWERRRDLNGLIQTSTGEQTDLQSFDLVINALNDMALLIREGYISIDGVISPMMRTIFLRSATVFRPYIEHRRTHRLGGLEEEVVYAQHLQWVVEELQRRGAQGSRSRLATARRRFNAFVDHLDERLAERNGRESFEERVTRLEKHAALVRTGSPNMPG
jgi:hypothetical protein